MSEPLFPASPTLTLYDPLGEMLGAGDGLYHYSFDDVVKLSGHACPTVAGAFVMAKRALELLYGEATPRRGNIAVEFHGALETSSNGPFTQVLTLITGAAADNGFKGLAGKEVRKGLLAFDGSGEPPARCSFRRNDTGQSVTLEYRPNAMPNPPELDALMPLILRDEADEAQTAQFRRLWRSRIDWLLEDGGEQSIAIVAEQAN